MLIREIIEGRGIEVGVPKTGNLYRWVQAAKALSNLKTNSLNPGKWTHKIPGVGIAAGISFGYSDSAWRDSTETNTICFVVDRAKLNPKKIADIPADPVFNYGDYRLDPNKPADPNDPMFADAEQTEAFYAGIIRPLDRVLVEIIIPPELPKHSRLRMATIAYAQQYSKPVRLYKGWTLDI